MKKTLAVQFASKAFRNFKRNYCVKVDMNFTKVVLKSTLQNVRYVNKKCMK